MRHDTPRLERQQRSTEKKIARYEQRLQRKVERRGTKNLAALALLGTIAAGEHAYWNDVHKNQEVQAQASISIEVKGEPLDSENADSAIVFMNGFGQNDADNITHYLGPAIQQIVDGELWSVGYGNAPLDPQNITDRIIELAEVRDIDRVSFLGYSAGGIIAMEVIEKLYEQSNLRVEAIIPTSTPDGDEGLRPEQREAKDILMGAAEIVPGAKYSTLLRYAGEMAFRLDMYNDGGPLDRWNDFWKTSDRVTEAMRQQRLPGTWLMVDQTLAISNARLESRIQHIATLAEERKTVKPVIVYLGTAAPGYDAMVDDTSSAENICAYAAASGLQCLIYDVPGAVHNRPDLAGEAYMKTIAAAESDINVALHTELAHYLLLHEPKIIDDYPLLWTKSSSEADGLAATESSQSPQPSS